MDGALGSEVLEKHDNSMKELAMVVPTVPTPLNPQMAHTDLIAGQQTSSLRMARAFFRASNISFDRWFLILRINLTSAQEEGWRLEAGRLCTQADALEGE